MLDAFSYFCVEKCRGCNRLVDSASAAAQTVCSECWGVLQSELPLNEICSSGADTLLEIASGAPYVFPLKKLLYRLKYDDDVLVAQDLAVILHRAWTCLIPQIVSSSNEGEPVQVVLMPVPLHWRRKLFRGFNQAEVLARLLHRNHGKAAALAVGSAAARFVPQSEASAASHSVVEMKYADFWMPSISSEKQDLGAAPSVSLGATGVDRTKLGAISLSVDARTLKRKRATRAHHGLGRVDRLDNVSGAFVAERRAYSTPSDVTIVIVDDIYTSGATLVECANALRHAGFERIFGLAVARALFDDSDSP